MHVHVHTLFDYCLVSLYACTCIHCLVMDLLQYVYGLVSLCICTCTYTMWSYLTVYMYMYTLFDYGLNTIMCVVAH